MGRSLPRAHEDNEEALRKRRLQVFKLAYQGYYEWRSLRDTGMTILDSLPTPDGEEIHMPDLLTGYTLLPRRQQQSFELICLQSYTEAAATIEIYGPDETDELHPSDSPGNPPRKKRSSTVVQQYAQQALERMVQAYDEKQSGTWDPEAVMKTRKLNGRIHGTPGRTDVAPSPSRDGLEAGKQSRRAAG